MHGAAAALDLTGLQAEVIAKGSNIETSKCAFRHGQSLINFVCYTFEHTDRERRVFERFSDVTKVFMTDRRGLKIYKYSQEVNIPADGEEPARVENRIGFAREKAGVSACYTSDDMSAAGYQAV